MGSRGSSLALTVLALLYCQPLHPYGVQRLIKDWGKDQVVNVGQRTSVYRTIERLHTDGLITVKDTERDQAYPERTVYEITEAGRATVRGWLLEMLSTPKPEFPQFPAALSHALMLAPAELRDALAERLRAMTATLEDLEARLAAHEGGDLPRIGLIEFEYLRDVTAAEVRWLEAVLAELRTGGLTWDAEMFARFEGEPPGSGVAPFP